MTAALGSDEACDSNVEMVFYGILIIIIIDIILRIIEKVIQSKPNLAMSKAPLIIKGISAVVGL